MPSSQLQGWKKYFFFKKTWSFPVYDVFYLPFNDFNDFMIMLFVGSWKKCCDGESQSWTQSKRRSWTKLSSAMRKTTSWALLWAWIQNTWKWVSGVFVECSGYVARWVYANIHLCLLQSSSLGWWLSLWPLFLWRLFSLCSTTSLRFA